MTPRLFHYTCGHGRSRLGAAGRLEPNGYPRLVWLTDMDTPDRVALGLTSAFLECDRLAHRYVVRPSDAIVHWPGSAVAEAMDPTLRAELEQDRQPEHWWVSPVSLRATIDLRYRP